mmetsp:Transcript_15418/g.37977  ORF Transcript_15418/g.37977 Transcript_15418/m.37977 type:complete len:169 (-) Transcript_15418:168-674(-)
MEKKRIRHGMMRGKNAVLSVLERGLDTCCPRTLYRIPFKRRYGPLQQIFQYGEMPVAEPVHTEPDLSFCVRENDCPTPFVHLFRSRDILALLNSEMVSKQFDSCNSSLSGCNRRRDLRSTADEVLCRSGTAFIYTLVAYFGNIWIRLCEILGGHAVSVETKDTDSSWY